MALRKAMVLKKFFLCISFFVNSFCFTNIDNVNKIVNLKSEELELIRANPKKIFVHIPTEVIDCINIIPYDANMPNCVQKIKLHISSGHKTTSLEKAEKVTRSVINYYKNNLAVLKNYNEQLKLGAVVIRSN